MPTTADHFHDWDGPRFGLPQATLISAVLVALLLALAAWLITPKPVMTPPIQVTQATLTSLPRPTPPPPKVVPPPKPVTPVIPKPPPVQSKIQVATKPPPPVHHVQPPPRPVIHHVEAPPRPTPPQPAAPVSNTPPPPHAAPAAAPAPVSTSGIGPYGDAIHSIIQSNQNVPASISTMGLSGTAVIRLEVAPSGQVVSATVVKSSGNPLIDQTALDHARNAHFPPFTSNMPGTTLSYTVPVEITGGDGGDDGN